MPHIILLLFVAGENPDFPEIIDKPAQNGMAKRTSTSCYQQNLVIKHVYPLFSFFNDFSGNYIQSHSDWHFQLEIFRTGNSQTKP